MVIVDPSKYELQHCILHDTCECLFGDIRYNDIEWGYNCIAEGQEMVRSDGRHGNGEISTGQYADGNIGQHRTRVWHIPYQANVLL